MAAARLAPLRTGTAVQDASERLEIADARAPQGSTGINLPTKTGGPEGLPSGDPPDGSTVTAKVALWTTAGS